MAYLVVSTSNHKILSGQKYLLDANIWINILTAPQNPPYRIKKYLTFFEKLLKNEDIKIIVPMLLISEVINRIIRDVHYIAFLNKSGLEIATTPKKFFKDVFRPSKDYIDSFEILFDEFNSYSDYIEFTNDGFNNDIKIDSILGNVDQYFDFNDNFYYQLAKVRNYIIVTDDGDFWREDVHILTDNNTLLDRQTTINIKNNAEKGVIKFGSLTAPKKQ